MTPDSSYLIGRQPILGVQEELFAYELLFRSPKSISSAAVGNPVQATSRVIFNTLSGFGIHDILGEHRGFVNVDLDMLMSDALEILPPHKVGLELLESIPVTPDVIARCHQLKSKGFILLLDDHVYDPACKALYNGIIDIVKIDLILTPLAQLYQVVEQFRPYPVRLLAEKVDSRHAYLRCRKMGFELFQGYFFARPSLIQKQRMKGSSSSFLRLLQKLNNEAEIAEIELIFKENPMLTYKLLLLVNSVSMGMRTKIQSVRHAITSVGLQQLKRWVQIAIFAAENSSEDSSPLIETAGVRATFMEELARLHPGAIDNRSASDEAFMVGILSLLNEIFEVTVDDMINMLDLSDESRIALTSREGYLGTILLVVELIERNKFDEAAEILTNLNIPISSVLECQKKAFSWRAGTQAKRTCEREQYDYSYSASAFPVV
jgi:c-di-GMP-related signal transduction protein